MFLFDEGVVEWVGANLCKGHGLNGLIQASVTTYSLSVIGKKTPRLFGLKDSDRGDHKSVLPAESY